VDREREWVGNAKRAGVSVERVWESKEGKKKKNRQKNRSSPVTNGDDDWWQRLEGRHRSPEGGVQGRGANEAMESVGACPGTHLLKHPRQPTRVPRRLSMNRAPKPDSPEPRHLPVPFRLLSAPRYRDTCYRTLASRRIRPRGRTPIRNNADYHSKYIKGDPNPAIHSRGYQG
jgi:hypothetical protein